MNRNRYCALILLALIAYIAGCNGGSGGAGGSGGGSSDTSLLQGSWKITQMATDGEYLPPEKINTAGTLVFEGDKYIRKQNDKVQDEWTFTVDNSTNPKQLLVSRGVSGGKERFSYLIYKIEGDTLTVKSGSPSFPTDFTTETVRGCYLTVYKRSGN